MGVRVTLLGGISLTFFSLIISIFSQGLGEYTNAYGKNYFISHNSLIAISAYLLATVGAYLTYRSKRRVQTNSSLFVYVGYAFLLLSILAAGSTAGLANGRPEYLSYSPIAIGWMITYYLIGMWLILQFANPTKSSPKLENNRFKGTA